MQRVMQSILMFLTVLSTGAIWAQLPPLDLELLASDLEKPVDFTSDGTERIFIVEQPGRIRLMRDGRLEPQPYLDITDRVRDGGECGLLGLAFHPEFATNGRFFVNYTTGQRRDLRTVISEFRAEPDATPVDPRTERLILTFDQPYSNHNGGQVLFGPDGMLYITTGDGGSANDPHNNGQRTDTLLGKILRIDVNQDSGYAIPKDNPFVGQSGYLPEIWALGLRNAWRFSFDRATGVCYAGDVGQNLYEEIDIIVKGGNYGWRQREGLHPFQGGRDSPEFIDPIVEYGRHLGISVTGGYVYRGKKHPSLQGIYIYADYATGRFWGLRYEQEVVVFNEEFEVTVNGRRARNRLQPSSFGEDTAGKMYVCDHGGRIYKITVTRLGH